MRRTPGRIAIILVIAVILVIVAAGAGGYWFVTRSLPQTTGTLHVAGLSSRVEVIRDAQGVPHIYADNPGDLFMAQGYVHAQDRLWEMELNRHVGHGQLAELFGDVEFGSSTTVKADKFLRTLGLARAAENDLAVMDETTRGYLQKYADGVNAYIAANANNLPIEFTLLGDNPTPWTPLDSVVWGKVMAYDLGGNYERELRRAALGKELGEETMRQLFPAYPEQGPFVISPNVKNYADSEALDSPAPNAEIAIGKPDLADIRAIDEALSVGGEGTGSNNWVLDGTRTTTGKPLLANDPHLGVQMPSIWYVNALHCNFVDENCPLDVAGFSFPGVPGVILGHNARIAWGVTNVNPDVQDLFVEKVNPTNPNQYEFEGKWLDMATENETIHVKGAADVPLTIQQTQHGVIMTPVLKGVTATLALEWTATREPSQLLQAVLAVDRARSWDEFRDALRMWDVPAQNFVYADTDGNIAYQMPGRVPIRAKGDGTETVPGWSGEYEWRGYVPFDELPFVLNPSTHSIASANNQIVPDSYKYLITRDWEPPFRATRIGDLIQSKDKLSPSDFAAFQGDVYSMPLVKLQRYVVPLATDGFLARRAMPYVRDWNGVLDKDSIGGAILESTYRELLRAVIGKRMGAEAFEDYEGDSDAHRLLIDQLLDEPQNEWWDDPETTQVETRDDVLAKAYWNGVDWLGSQFGDWPPEWHWGRLHNVTFAHPFGSVEPLNLLFNAGPITTPGDGYTLFNTGFDGADPFATQMVPSMRDIVDLSNFDASEWMNTTGQSGQPLSAHYSDLVRPWRDVQYEPLFFTRAAVDKNKTGTLELVP